MENIEIPAIAIIISLLSIHSALSARYDITEVPWMKLITGPRYFGGLNTLIRNVSWLVCWIVISNIFMFICFIIIKSSEAPISIAYDLINYKSETGGKADLTTLILVISTLYLMLVRQTSKIVRSRNNYIPKEHLYPEDSNYEDDGKEEKKKSVKDKGFVLIRQIYYIAPSIFASIYIHFWRSAGLVKHGCVRLLYDKYGEDNVLAFYQEHADQSPDKATIDEINKQIASANSLRNRAFGILSAKISIKGYHNTNGLINNYIISKSNGFDINRRKAKRSPVNKLLKLNGLCDGKRCRLILIDYSIDGSSLYVLFKWPANISNSITLNYKEFSVFCDVIHRNARKYRGKVQLGMALRTDQKHKKALLNLLRSTDILSA